MILRYILHTRKCLDIITHRLKQEIKFRFFCTHLSSRLRSLLFYHTFFVFFEAIACLAASPKRILLQYNHANLEHGFPHRTYEISPAQSTNYVEKLLSLCMVEH